MVTRDRTAATADESDPAVGATVQRRRRWVAPQWGMGIGMPSWTRLGLLAVALLTATPLVTGDEPIEKAGAAGNPAFATRFRVGQGEVTQGDRYIFGQSVLVNGRHEGDLVVFGTAVTVNGTITGDLMAWGQVVTINGTVEDSVRVAANSLSVSGTITGDVLFGGVSAQFTEASRVGGSVTTFAGDTSTLGRIDRDLYFTGGELDLGGVVGGTGSVHADTFRVDPDLEVRGDLVYSARDVSEESLRPLVGGEVSYREEPIQSDDDSDEGWFGFGSLLRVAFVIWSLLAGTILLAAWRNFPARIDRTIRQDFVMGTLIGFGTFLVLPPASLLLLPVLLPVGLVGMVLFLLVVLVGKVPVALWLGGWLLGRLRRAPSPYLSLLVGVIALSLLVAIPYVGWLLWALATWLGAGSFVLALREWRERLGKVRA